MEECVKVLEEGDKRKTVFPTQMNPGSSRGHMVFKLTLEKSGGDGTRLHCEVYFADLAGHENIKQTLVEGDRLTELKNINSSLMYLQRAIHSLATSSAHKGHKEAKVNYSIFRNSELTLLLANGLTGNSQAAVIVTLSPAARHFETSLSSIEFGLEVKGIKLDVHSTVTVDPAVQLKKLTDEVTSLKAQLAAAIDGKSIPGMSPTGESVGYSSDAALTKEMQDLKEENQRLKDDIASSTGNGAGDAKQVETLRKELSDLKEENQKLKAEKGGAAPSSSSEEEQKLKVENERLKRMCYSRDNPSTLRKLAQLFNVKVTDPE